MAVDSGLPGFRGNQRFWKVHSAFKKEQLSFQDLANLRWFYENPQSTWGFYDFRHQLYNRTQPHQGFQFLNI